MKQGHFRHALNLLHRANELYRAENLLRDAAEVDRIIVECYLSLNRYAEARGYHTAWLGEVSGYDAIVMSTVVATHTERLHVANGVLPVQTRTPVVLGMATASLNHFAPGRFALGLGLSSRAIVEQWNGLVYAPALGQIREAVESGKQRLARLVQQGNQLAIESPRKTPEPVRVR